MADAVPASRRATLIGGGAIALWSALAPLAASTRALPPLEVTGIGLMIGGLAGLGCGLAGLYPWRDAFALGRTGWLLGIYGLFGYHALYFTAMGLGPAVEVNLVNYLWPLLIVLLSGPILGRRLGPLALGGAALGFGGVASLIGPAWGEPSDGTSARLIAQGAALACALVWASFSVLSRRIAHVPTAGLTGLCLVSGALALTLQAASGGLVAPETGAWAALVPIGLGPLGLAFFAWDHAMKRGDVMLVGAAANATPLLSTALLAASGGGALGPREVIAAALIVTGAVLVNRGAG